MAHLLQLDRPDATPRLPATAEAVTLTPSLSHGPQQDPVADIEACRRFVRSCLSPIGTGMVDRLPDLPEEQPIGRVAAPPPVAAAP